MQSNKYFGSDDSNELWDSFFRKVDLLLAKVPYEQSDAIRKELESHVFEAMQEQTSGNELEKLEQVLKELGDPDDIVPPMIAAAHIQVAKSSNNPLDMLRVASVQIGQGIVNTLRSLSIVILNLMGFTFLVMAVMKPFRPEHVGFFTSRTGQASFGIIGNTDLMVEHLGYSVIPIAVAIAVLLFKLSKLMLNYTRLK